MNLFVCVCIFKNFLLEWFYNPPQPFSCCLSLGCFDYFYLELWRFCTLFVPKKLVFISGFICFKLIPYNELEFVSKFEMHTKLVFRDVLVAVFGRLSFPSILFYCRPSFDNHKNDQNQNICLTNDINYISCKRNTVKSSIASVIFSIFANWIFQINLYRDWFLNVGCCFIK